MTPEHVYIFLLVAAATVLLALEKAQLGVIGIGLIVALAVPELISAKEAIAGFANTAVVTVGALFIVGEGLQRSGAASIFASRILASTGGSETTVVILIMLMAAILSAFINNILVVITFLPVVTSICRSTGLYPSRLLIPLSYASILGGMCTLVGTSTNLLISGVLEESGLPSIGMFEMSLPGLLIVGAGFFYIALVGRHLLPRIHSLAAQVKPDDFKEYVTEISVDLGSSLIGKSPNDVVGKTEESNLYIAMLVRGERVFRPPFAEQRIHQGDILVASGEVSELANLHTPESRKKKDNRETEHFDPTQMSFFELSPTPISSRIGLPIGELELKARYGAVVVGLLRNGHHQQTRIADLHLRTGDVLLAFGNDSSREALRHSGDFNLIEGVDEKIYRRHKAPVAGMILVIVVILFITGLIHPCTAALSGALAMVVTGCLSVQQAHHAVNWPLIMFIAGTLAVSKSLQVTGADLVIGQLLSDSLGASGPFFLLAGLYVATIVFTELLSNNAVAVMMTTVALATAEVAGLDPRPLVMAVLFGASSCFASPIGYHTNLLVFGPGGYRFRDFLKVGIGLDLVLGSIGILAVSYFFPL
ncbi:MAG: SLC13 family permease [Planctomycetota bacterium]|jgi:di/tricarboxylate transporter